VVKGYEYTRGEFVTFTRVERWSIDRLIPYAKKRTKPTPMPRSRRSRRASKSGAGRVRRWWARDGGPDRGPREDTRRPAARHRRDPGHGGRGLERGPEGAPTLLADNQLAITGSGWDPELLRLELGELKLTGFDLTLTGFNDLELGSLLVDKTEGLTDPDDAPGDSRASDLANGRFVDPRAAPPLVRRPARSRRTWSACLGGVEPHLMVTDPPYGVEYDPAWRDPRPGCRWAPSHRPRNKAKFFRRQKITGAAPLSPSTMTSRAHRPPSGRRVMVAAGWSEAQKRAYVLADNQLAITGSGVGPGAAAPRARRAEAYRLRPHAHRLQRPRTRLAARGQDRGLTDPDDRSRRTWERVLGGVEPHLMVTDPPYGVEYDPAWRNKAKFSDGKKSQGPRRSRLRRATPL